MTKRRNVAYNTSEAPAPHCQTLPPQTSRRRPGWSPNVPTWLWWAVVGAATIAIMRFGWPIAEKHASFPPEASYQQELP